MKTGFRFITYCKQIAEWLATLVFGSLALLAVLVYSGIGKPLFDPAAMPTGAALVMQVSRHVLCMVPEALRVILPL